MQHARIQEYYVAYFRNKYNYFVLVITFCVKGIVHFEINF